MAVDLTYAQQMLAKLRQGFLAELPERLDEMERLTLALGGERFAAQFGELYRKVHSLKGSGGTHGLHPLSAVCHQFEDHLNAVGGEAAKSSPLFIDGCLRYLDLLREVTAQAAAGAEQFPRLEHELNRLRARLAPERCAALLVEPSRTAARLSADLLTARGFDVAVVEDGYVALGRLLAQHFDLLVTAAESPMLSGRALIAAARTSHGNKRDFISLLVTSGEAPPVHRRSDPDFVVVRGSGFVADFDAALAGAAAELYRRHGGAAG